LTVKCSRGYQGHLGQEDIIDTIPNQLKVVAVSADDGVVMAVEHKELPIAAVQFHPESIMSLDDNVGIELVRSVVRNLTKRNS
jgi:anthranilate synthase